QVEDAAVQTLAVPVAAADAHRVGGKYGLSVADVLKAAGKPDAHTIKYWLRATDNRDPDPQWSDSARQTLHVQKGAEAAAQKIEQEQGKELAEAIRKAIEDLDRTKPAATDAQKIDK